MAASNVRYYPLSTDPRTELDVVGENVSERIPSIQYLCSLIDLFFLKCKAFADMNTGLLLVATSQIFFALMHTAVKVINSLDPPISALEVCRAPIISYS